MELRTCEQCSKPYVTPFKNWLIRLDFCVLGFDHPQFKEGSITPQAMINQHEF